MPAATKATRPTVRRTTKATTPPPKNNNVQQTLVEDPPQPTRPREHKGVQVVREELFSNLPNGAPFRVSRLYLVDDTIAYACRDCLTTADTRALINRHRNEEHGARFGKKAPKVLYDGGKQVADGDLVLPLRPDGTAAPQNVMNWTLAEFMALVPSIGALSDLIEKTEHERDMARIELAERRKTDRENAHKVAVYESLHAEVVELRVMVKNSGAYESLKTEVLELRAWKKQVSKKLETLGFKLIEEDQ